MKTFLERTLLVFFGLAAGLLLFEICASWVLPRPRMYRFPLLKMQADPQVGYRYEPNQEGYALESKVMINSTGFRGPERKLEKDPGVIRIALLGDSYVFGQGVGEDETIAAALERILNAQAPAGTRYEVLNFGISGYDSGHEIEVLKHYALQFRPDMVFFCFFLNDLFYIKDYGFYPQLFLEDRKRFSLRKWWLWNLFRSSRVAMYVWDIYKGTKVSKNELAQVIRSYAVEHTLPPQGPKPEGWEFVLDRLSDLKRLSGQKDFEAFLAVIPSPEEIQRGQSAPYVDYLLGEGSRLGVRPVSIFEGFQKAGMQSWAKWLIPYDCHFDAAGNEIVAGVFAKAVLEEKNP